MSSSCKVGTGLDCRYTSIRAHNGTVAFPDESTDNDTDTLAGLPLGTDGAVVVVCCSGKIVCAYAKADLGPGCNGPMFVMPDVVSVKSALSVKEGASYTAG